MIVTFCHYQTLERMYDAMSPVLRSGVEMDLPPLMVRSVREAMPNAQIVMLTDEWTTKVDGVDEVIRRPRKCPMSMHRLEHWATCPYDEWVTVDTDVIVRKSIEDVFERSFDVALTLRRRPLKMPPLPIQHYNIGVMFSRNPDFWQESWASAKAQPYRVQELFMADQLAVCMTAPKYNTLDLPMVEFNYKPGSSDDSCPGSRVVHYAGLDRKKWMVARYGADK